MSEYTHLNLKADVNDVAAETSGGAIEARFGRTAIESEHLGVTYMRFAPGAKLPFGHSHKVQEEAYVVTAGSGSVRLGDETRELKQWDVVRVSPAVIRGFIGGADGLEMVAIGSDRPEEGDGERHPDFWDA